MTTNLPSPQEAYDKVSQVAHRYFFQKLAQDGIVPQNQAEATTLVELAGMLRGIPSAKEAHDRFAPLVGVARQQLGQTPSLKQACYDLGGQLARNEEYYNVALSLKTAQAVEAMKQNQQVA